MDNPHDLSDCELDSGARVRLVLDVTDVPVSPSSVCDVSPCSSDWEFVEPQSFSFSQKRTHWGTDTQEKMRHKGSPMKAHPLSRRRVTPPTPLQNSYTSFVRNHGRCEEGEDGMRERKNTYREHKTVSGKKFQCLGAS